MTKAATFQNPMFHDEDKAREALEAELWPDGPICRHCGNSDPEKIAKVEGVRRSHRPGLYYCNECKGQFTVTVGTVLERSKVPLTKWLMAAHMFNSGKNGVSAHEIHRTLNVSYKTAWFMMHRLREAMNELSPSPMGGGGKSVQADETYYGNSSKRAKSYRKGHSHKASVVAFVEPHGRARAFHVKRANKKAVREILVTNADRKSALHTDESNLYLQVGKEFATHKTVEHGSMGYGFFVANDGTHTNSAENFFDNFKRSMRGTYRFCSEQHLQRYLNEFQFRHNHRAKLGFNDGERTAAALKGIEGKRLTYRPTDEAKS
ncbi:MAG: IS1595 family transposase [Xanthobacteraceae bacterium]